MTPRNYLLRRISSGTGVLSEVFLYDIREEDENTISQLENFHNPLLEVRKELAEPVLPDGNDLEILMANENESVTPLRPTDDEAEVEAPSSEPAINVDAIKQSGNVSNRLSWADEVEEESGPAPSLHNIEEQATYTLAGYLQSEHPNNEVGPGDDIDQKSDNSSIHSISDSSSDSFETEADQFFREAEQEAEEATDVLINLYQAMQDYEKLENRRDLLEWRRMKAASKPSHLLRDYDLYLDRCRERRLLWAHDQKALIRELPDLEQVVRRRLSEIERKWSVGGKRRHTIP